MRTQRVAQMFEDAGRRAGEAAYEKSTELYATGRRATLTMAHAIEECVLRQPMRSILFAIGAVCLITSAFVRR